MGPRSLLELGRGGRGRAPFRGAVCPAQPRELWVWTGFLAQVPLATLLRSGGGKETRWPFLSPAPAADIFLFLPAGTDSPWPAADPAAAGHALLLHVLVCAAWAQQSEESTGKKEFPRGPAAVLSISCTRRPGRKATGAAALAAPVRKPAAPKHARRGHTHGPVSLPGAAAVPRAHPAARVRTGRCRGARCWAAAPWGTRKAFVEPAGTELWPMPSGFPGACGKMKRVVFKGAACDA